MKKIYIYMLFFLLLNTAGKGQVRVDMGKPVLAGNDPSSVHVYGADELNSRIPYYRITGSPFWDEKWHQGMIYNKSGKLLGKCPVRINFATQLVHFLDPGGKEMVPDGDMIGKVIVLDDEDSSRIISIFNNDVTAVEPQTRYKDHLVQDLNQGRCRLLKITHREIRAKDSIFGSGLKKYYFEDLVEYYVSKNGKAEKLRRLNRDQFFARMPDVSMKDEWIKKENLEFREEKDFIYFLDHYNHLH